MVADERSAERDFLGNAADQHHRARLFSDMLRRTFQDNPVSECHGRIQEVHQCVHPVHVLRNVHHTSRSAYRRSIACFFGKKSPVGGASSAEHSAWGAVNGQKALRRMWREIGIYADPPSEAGAQTFLFSRVHQGIRAARQSSARAPRRLESHSRRQNRKLKKIITVRESGRYLFFID